MKSSSPLLLRSPRETSAVDRSPGSSARPALIVRGEERGLSSFEVLHGQRRQQPRRAGIQNCKGRVTRHRHHRVPQEQRHTGDRAINCQSQTAVSSSSRCRKRKGEMYYTIMLLTALISLMIVLVHPKDPPPCPCKGHACPAPNVVSALKSAPAPRSACIRVA